MRLIELAVLVLTLVVVSQWQLIPLLVPSLSSDQGVTTKIDDEFIRGVARDKVGVELDSITLVNSERPFAFVTVAAPGAKVFISRVMYEGFEREEMEYVVLHELGHLQLQHQWKEVTWAVGLMMALYGLVLKLAPRGKRLIGVMIAGAVGGLLLIQIGRGHEYEADRYAVERLDNTSGAYGATIKLQRFYDANGKAYDEVWKWLKRGVPYTIRLAKFSGEADQ